MKIVSAHQPHYLPWIGYFHKIAQSNTFVIVDNVDFTRPSYINRNTLTGKAGQFNLTIPIKHSSNFKWIKDAEIDYYTNRWVNKHIRSLLHHYSSTEFSELFIDFISKALLKKHKFLFDLDVEIIHFLVDYLDIKTEIIIASEKNIGGQKETDLFLSLLSVTNSDTILIGKGASSKYMDREVILSNHYNIAIQDFKHPVYQQKSKSFCKGISALDFLMNVSKSEAINSIKNQSGNFTIYERD
jgi:hypothetical protein